MGSKGGGGGATQQSVTRSAPWGPLRPYLREYMGLLNNLTTGQTAADPSGASLTGGQLPQQQIAGFTPGEQQGLGLEYGTIPGQQGVVDTAAAQAQNILSGGMLSPSSNPYLQSYFNAAAQPMVNQYQAAIGPSQMSQAALSGAFGGSADAENRALGQYTLGNNLQQLAANVYEPAYQQGLDQMTKTLALAPQTAQGLGIPGGTALNAGGLEQQQAQNQLNAQYGNQYQQFMWPYQQLGYLGSGLTGLMGAGGSSVSNFPNPNATTGGGGLSGAIGGGLSGAGMGSMFGPWGMAIGGGLGALLGALR